jgi:uncharacterized membrane protein
MRDQESTSSGALAFVFLTLLVVLGCTVRTENETVSHSEPIPAEPVQERTEAGTNKADGFVGFRGRGNEPGWNLEIGPDNIVFITNYGSDRYELPTPSPEVNRGQGRTTYRTQANGHELIVVLEAKECRDTMADETFEMMVTVTLDGKGLNGCGTPLD